MNSFEVHGLVDVGRLTRIRSTGFSHGVLWRGSAPNASGARDRSLNESTHDENAVRDRTTVWCAGEQVTRPPVPQPFTGAPGDREVRWRRSPWP